MYMHCTCMWICKGTTYPFLLSAAAWWPKTALHVPDVVLWPLLSGQMRNSACSWGQSKTVCSWTCPRLRPEAVTLGGLGMQLSVRCQENAVALPPPLLSMSSPHFTLTVLPTSMLAASSGWTCFASIRCTTPSYFGELFPTHLMVSHLIFFGAMFLQNGDMSSELQNVQVHVPHLYQNQ